MLGDHEQAVAHYFEALRLNPNLAKLTSALGTHYIRLGKYEDALIHFKTKSPFLSKHAAGHLRFLAGVPTFYLQSR